MKATQLLHNLGQSIWLDNITRDLLDTGTLKRYIAELSVTGLRRTPRSSTMPSRTARPTMRAIREKLKQGKSGEALFFELALEDLTRAADLFRPICEQTQRRGRLGVVGGLAVAGPRHGEHAGRGQGAACPGRAARTLHQDSRHEGGPAGHRGGDLRRRADQRDAAVLARALSRRRRGVSARHRAPHGCRPQSQRRLGRLGVHQPLGRGGRRARFPPRSRTELGIAIAQRTYKA